MSRVMHSTGLGPNQVCTLFGSTPGSTVVPGPAYVSAGYGIEVADQWRRNFLVVVGFFLLFQLTQVLLIEFYPVSRSSVRHDAHCYRSCFFPAIHRRRRLAGLRQADAGDEQAERGAAGAEGDARQVRADHRGGEDPVQGSQVRVLHASGVRHAEQISAASLRARTAARLRGRTSTTMCLSRVGRGGCCTTCLDMSSREPSPHSWVPPAQVRAVWTVSWTRADVHLPGKTTCLDVLAQRKNIGVIAGSMLVDGRPLGGDFARGTAYGKPAPAAAF